MLVSECRRPGIGGRPKTRSVNSRYFDEIGPSQAYWLGYLLADGCVALRKQNGEVRQCVLQAASKDREHLEKLSLTLGSDYSLCGPYRGVWQLAVPNYDLCLSLEQYGIVPTKSYTAKPPQLPPELYSHWARGVIDGDGCFNTYWRNTRAVKNNGRGRPATAGRFVFMLAVTGAGDVTEWFRNRFGGSVSMKAGVTHWSLNDSRARAALAWAYTDSTPETRLDRKYEAAVRLGVVMEDGGDACNDIRESRVAQ